MAIYSAFERFTPADESWDDYIAWSGRSHATEIITTDAMLCSPAIAELTAEDWQHNLESDGLLHLFSDYEYLLNRIKFDATIHNIFELTKRPDSPLMPSASFLPCGYDILDTDDSISVLLNCGSFPGVFSPNETNTFGLIDELARAQEIAEDLRKANPTSHHCKDCRVWGISRYTDAG